MADYDFQTAGVGWQELSVLEAKRKLWRGLSPTAQRRLARVPGFPGLDVVAGAIAGYSFILDALPLSVGMDRPFALLTLVLDYAWFIGANNKAGPMQDSAVDITLRYWPQIVQRLKPSAVKVMGRLLPGAQQSQLARELNLALEDYPTHPLAFVVMLCFGLSQDEADQYDE